MLSQFYDTMQATILIFLNKRVVMTKLKSIKVNNYEKVYMVLDEESGLEGIIAIHSTEMGPAVGGVRACSYSSFDDALEDVLRLSMGMTYKCLLAGAPLGGGKGVIIWDTKKPIPQNVLIAFAEAVNMLDGEYYTAEDSGTTQEDLVVLKENTPFVVGVEAEGSSGNPCSFTAWGVLQGICASLFHLYGSDSIAGKRVAIQGVGNVGTILADYLFWRGAELIICDLDPKKTKELERKYDTKVVAPEKIYDVPCDIFCPCALGGTINPQTIGRIKARIVAGCANNQLASDEDADLLKKRGILYAPDYVINAGGLLSVAREIKDKNGGAIIDGAYALREMVDKIYSRLIEIYCLSDENSCSTEKSAKTMAHSKLKSSCIA